METITLHPEIKLAATKKRPIFKDQIWQKMFDRDGYVVIDFLTAAEIDVLTRSYADLQGDLGEPAFASTIMSRDPSYRLAVSALIENVFARAVNETFTEARFFWGNFNVKYPAGNNIGALPMHQDPSFVDDRLFSPLGIWAPLVDITPENGPLQVVPGSHNLLKQPRCGARPFPYHSEQDILLKKFGRQLLMHAGQAYIGSPAVFHSSPANMSNRPRIVAAGLTGPCESELRYFHYNELNGMAVAEMYEVDYDYYVTAPLFSQPDESRYRVLETIPLVPEPTIDVIFEQLSYLNKP